MILKGLSGKTYQLAEKPFSSGGEGDIYSIANMPGGVVKVYHADRITQELEEKLLVMCKRPPSREIFAQIAWPVDLAYDLNGAFQGFVMLRLNITDELSAIYAYPPKKNISYKAKVIIAQNICAVISEIHRAGFVFGDFNPKNIGIDLNTCRVAFLDTDSYHIVDGTRTYRCKVCLDGYVAPELLKKCEPYKTDAYARTPLPTFTHETDNFALAIHIFRLLMNGYTPFNGIRENESISTASPGTGNQAIKRDNYCFKPGNKPQSVAVPPLSVLPGDIADLFTRAFMYGRIDPAQRPTAAEWHKALLNYENSLASCPNNSAHMYQKELQSCPWCEADDRYAALTAEPPARTHTGSPLPQKTFSGAVVPVTPPPAVVTPPVPQPPVSVGNSSAGGGTKPAAHVKKRWICTVCGYIYESDFLSVGYACPQCHYCRWTPFSGTGTPVKPPPAAVTQPPPSPPPPVKQPASPPPKERYSVLERIFMVLGGITAFVPWIVFQVLYFLLAVGIVSASAWLDYVLWLVFIGVLVLIWWFALGTAAAGPGLIAAKIRLGSRVPFFRGMRAALMNYFWVFALIVYGGLAAFEIHDGSDVTKAGLILFVSAPVFIYGFGRGKIDIDAGSGNFGSRRRARQRRKGIIISTAAVITTVLSILMLYWNYPHIESWLEERSSFSKYGLSQEEYVPLGEVKCSEEYCTNMEEAKKKVAFSYSSYDSSSSLRERDNFGTYYENRIIGCGKDASGTYNETEAWREYQLDGSYSEIRGRIIMPWNKSADNRRTDNPSASCLRIFGDGVVVYRSEPVTAGSDVQDFTVDISGFSTLKIHIQGCELLRLVDCGLYKDSSIPTVSTAKEPDVFSKSQAYLSELPIFNVSGFYVSGPADGYLVDYGEVTDNWGTTYTSGCFLSTYNNSNNTDEDMWCDFRPNGRYRNIQGKVVLNGEYQDSTLENVYFAIYGDGELLYQSLPVTAGCEPQAFDIDISGVTTLRVASTDHTNNILRVVDCILYKNS